MNCTKSILYLVYYKEMFNKYSILCKEINHIIIEYTLDLHYDDFKKVLNCQLEDNLVLYINWVCKRNREYINEGLKPRWFPKYNLDNVSHFLNLTFPQIHVMNGFKFYKKDLIFIEKAMRECKMVYFDLYEIRFCYGNGKTVTLSYDVFTRILQHMERAFNRENSKLNPYIQFTYKFE